MREREDPEGARDATASRLSCVVAIAPGVAAVAGSRAQATTFAEITIGDLARASDLVVIGRVEHIDVNPRGPAGQAGVWNGEP